MLKGDQKGLAEFKAEKRAFKELYGKISIIPLVNRNFYMDKLRRYSNGSFLQRLYILLLLLNEEVTPL